MFKTAAEVQAECHTAGIAPDDTVYLYCFKGARASNTFVALKQAGFNDVRMYFGSWNEWSRDPSLPIEEGFPRCASSSVRQLAAGRLPCPARGGAGGAFLLARLSAAAFRRRAP